MIAYFQKHANYDGHWFRICTILIWLICTGGLCISYALGTQDGADAYRIGDWLINYQGGAIRRGLIGQLLYYLPFSSVGIYRATTTLQIAIVIATALLTLRIFLSSPKNQFWWLCLFSPAFFISFSLYDLGGAFRKEIMVFLALALLARGLLLEHLNKQFIFAGIFCYTIACFSHESSVLCLPFFLWLLYRKYQAKPDTRQFLQPVAVLISLIAISALGFAILFPGSNDATVKICQSWTARGFSPQICSGSMQWLSANSELSLRFVRAEVSNSPFLAVYSLLAALALLPMILTNWYRKKANFVLLICASFFLAPLFFLGIDWGRWIYIYITLLFICLFFDDSQAPIATPSTAWLWILPYILLWSIPVLLPGKIGVFNTYSRFAPGLGMIDVLYRHLALYPQNPLNITSEWESLLNHYQTITFYPLEKNSALQNQFVLQALKRHLQTNASYFNVIHHSKILSHLSEKEIEIENEKTLLLIQKNQLNPASLYLIDPVDALSYYTHSNSDDVIATLNNITLIAPHYLRCANCLPIPYANQWGQTSPVTLLGNTITFGPLKTGKNPFLTKGWDAFSEPWGTWSIGKEAQIVLPTPKESANTLELNVRALINGHLPTQELIIHIPGTATQTFTLSEFENNRIWVKIPPNPKNNLLVLNLDIPRATRPSTIGLGNDSRLLGIGIKTARFLNI